MVNNAQETAPDAVTNTGEPGAAESVFEATSGWLSATRGRAALIARLAAAEARLAAASLALIIALATVIAVLALSAWGLLIAGLVYAAFAAGIPMWAALTGMAVLHIAAALVILRYATGLGGNLTFQATRRQFADEAETMP